MFKSAFEIRKAYLDFFRLKGHAIIPSASLIPENDPTVLFTTAGMHPLVPYLMGEPHPMGNRLADAQKCLRTDDIDEVGDNRHLTFFEMLGNWSLGDYFKRESITWSFEFLTDKNWLAIDPTRLFVTVFEGDDAIPLDDESVEIWQAQFEVHGISAETGVAGKDEPAVNTTGSRIFAYGKKENWWGPPGETGPCGPDTEIFYDTKKGHDSKFGKICHPNCDCGRFIEIWNNVFMEYEKKGDGSFVALAQKNVDTGMGLERISAMLQGKASVFDTEIFRGVFDAIRVLTGYSYGDDPIHDRSFRIIADHVRASTFVIGDSHGVTPSNVGQGYIVRRLLRRAIREGRRLGIKDPFLVKISSVVIGEFRVSYDELETNRKKILDEISKEEEKFGKTLEKGERELEKMITKGDVTGKDAFILFSTYGFPLELTEEIIHERDGVIHHDVFEEEFKKHQDSSRSASARMFKGGLADHSEETTRLHTATHLLHRALKNVLGDTVSQKGSNITKERLRFDFSWPEKMTDEQKTAVEKMVNDSIQKNLPVRVEEMSVQEAKEKGAIGLFEEKYGDKVKVYTIGDDVVDFSTEICGGPHVKQTGELGSFKIVKEEAVASGIRRIKAVVTG
ncbi:MAG: alanine--tRNA ligase [bacterium]|nr:alanine--tRNA ligase [bacterium]